MTNKVDTAIRIQDSLLHNINWWILHADDYILNIIQFGIQLPFQSVPTAIYLKNNKSALLETTFVSEEIEQLLLRGVISNSFDKPTVINPLTVAISCTGKRRLVLDLRHVNPHILLDNMKYEDLYTAKVYFKKNCYFNKFDLKSGYHHLCIHPNFRTFLGFQWPKDGIEQFYVFNALPFGLKYSA